MNYCLYHNNCRDGFAAAWCVWTKYGDQGWRYIGVNYQEDLPPEIYNDKNIDKIFIVDFSYPKNLLLKLSEICGSLVVVDHHKSAQSELFDLNLPNGIVIFNLEKCGAMLTCEFLFPQTVVPLFIKYIQDRDLWQWKMLDSQAVNAGIELLDYDFKIWDKLMEYGGIKEMRETGKVVLKYKNKLVNEIVEHVSIRDFEYNSMVYKNIGFVNCSPVFNSDVGNAWLKRNPASPFIMLYALGEKVASVSLRGADREYLGGKIDCGNICKILGGGGHTNAASFRIGIRDFQEMFLNG